jgi:cbb3-type cytochrome oxidase subunit 3
MIRRVEFEEWVTIITVTAFTLCFLTFLYFSWRAIRMNKNDRDHMSGLPLESEDNKITSSNEHSQET